ncbi:MAG TPA: hypothetical protein VL309_00920 [Vicinamibacterales bacterium]|nr:hypothetical protein [Vicinamibacterales bacterium]
MDVAVAVPAPPIRPRRADLVGRMFVSPLVDYFLVGGGLSIPIFSLLYLFPALNPVNGDIPYGFFIAINGAHFAASSVRLYTKPGARRAHPFLSWVFPILCFALVGLGLYQPRIGGHIKALYLTWAPFHYAAQTYGLAVMYAMRSGAQLSARDKAQIRWVCLLPFLYAFFTTTQGGLSWFIGRSMLRSVPAFALAHMAIVRLLMVAMLLLPVSLFLQLHGRRGRSVPLISLLLQLTNALWWLGSDYLDAWFWTAVFHSVQYLIVAAVRHVDERAAGVRPGIRAAILQGTAFYGFSLLVGCGLFLVAPSVFVLLGFSGVESYAMMTLVVNLHHFIVDGFVWRTKSRAAPHEQRAGAVMTAAPGLRYAS